MIYTWFRLAPKIAGALGDNLTALSLEHLVDVKREDANDVRTMLK